MCYPISPKIILVRIVPDLYIWLISRIHVSGKATGDLRTNTGNHLGKSGKVWRNRLSPARVRYMYRKSDRLLFLNTLKKVADQNPLAQGRLGRPRIFWRSPCLACPLELSCTLWSSLLLLGSGRLLFLNMFKNSSRSLFRYPTLVGLKRLRQTPIAFPDMRPINYI